MLDLNGRTLLCAGNKITEKHLTIFRTWGVSEVTIESSDPCADDQEPELLPQNIAPELLQRLENELESYFQFATADHAVTRELRHYLIMKRARAALQAR
ncbi:hypothetical protein D5085_04905 [Ectothiorhodospiraceae bacterium BW-2]|nr:hypothetical protein D5085_04905 [Ectothiorhodospiraceae bacterium BW-2]